MAKRPKDRFPTAGELAATAADALRPGPPVREIDGPVAVAWPILTEGAGTSSDASPTTSGGTAPPTGRHEVYGVTFVEQAVVTDETCVGNARGEVAAFFDRTDCTGLTRALYSTDVDGAPVVVAVSWVALPDEETALALRELADTPQTGNVDDLLREGVRYEHGPDELTAAEYASFQGETTVVIAETAWTDAEDPGDVADLDRLASAALLLPQPGTATG